jgi:hypothetical protein
VSVSSYHAFSQHTGQDVTLVTGSARLDRIGHAPVTATDEIEDLYHPACPKISGKIDELRSIDHTVSSPRGARMARLMTFLAPGFRLQGRQ